MKTRALLATIVTLVLFSCSTNQQEIEKSQETLKISNECGLISQNTVNEWSQSLSNSTYTIYENFDNIPFPIQLVNNNQPFPPNRQLSIHFGYSSSNIQNFYLFAVLLDGEMNTSMYYNETEIYYYSNVNNSWVNTNLSFFTTATDNWDALITNLNLLPTKAFTMPKADLIFCPFNQNLKIKFGIDTQADIYYKLKIYFHEENIDAYKDDPVNFDSCTPCPPVCGTDPPPNETSHLLKHKK